jgi:putative ABC transport system permease protein
VDSALAVAQEAFPKAVVWGTLFDPADPFAEHYLGLVKRKAEQLGIRFVTVACTSPQDIAAGVQALRAQGVGGIMQIPSIMIGGGFPALIKQARELRLPVVAANTGYPGAPLAMGASFYDNGYAQGLLMIRVLRGESPADIPFRTLANPQLIVDLGAAAAFGVTIPPEVTARAFKVIAVTRDSAGVVTGTPSRSAATRSASPWEFWLSAVVLGLAFAALAWGVYIASRVLRFPDITPDGSFPLGAAVAATLIVGGTDPLVATVAAFFAGMVAGYVTGLLHTRLRVTELLAGILVMTALYSVNLHVMGRSNISLLDRPTLATRLHTIAPATAGWPSDVSFGVVFLALVVVLGTAFAWFLRTDFGTAMRAAGDNPAMITAQGVDRRGMVELALALANGLVAFSGALIAQYQGFADVGMGVGTLVAGWRRSSSARRSSRGGGGSVRRSRWSRSAQSSSAVSLPSRSASASTRST